MTEPKKNQFRLGYDNKGVSSLKDDQTGDIEFIWPGESFGGVNLQYEKSNGETVLFSSKTSSDKIHVIENNSDRTFYSKIYNDAEEELLVKWTFKGNGANLLYSISIENTSEAPVKIVDLAIPFPMNNKFEWGDDASKKVIRHSFISGDNSYIFWTRCNGQGPFLLMMPEEGARLEFFDLEDEKKGAGSFYRAYVHANGEKRKVEEKGCVWRQQTSSKILNPKGQDGSSARYDFTFSWIENYSDIRSSLYENGLIDVTLLPGMTVPENWDVKIALRTKHEISAVEPEFPEQTEISYTRDEGLYIYIVKFKHLGENLLTIKYGNNLSFVLEFFVTESIETLIKKRGNFLAAAQEKDASKWYNGLIKEWNMEKEVFLSPDNYDCIKGWRIYEVTCDDPGLCKPSFLAAKNAEYPVQKEVDALDAYIEQFVWGGLQRTEEEEYAYGIYGIPDWYKNRFSEDVGPGGRAHLWRIYDYPHIVLLYWSMYRISRDYTHIKTALSSEVYLERAYRTALALFRIPDEIVGWSAIKTGLYNEKVIEDIFDELDRIGQKEKADRLRNWWEKKVIFFVKENTDVFGSEYPFDTTGFESTHALAKYALERNIRLKEEEKEEFYKKAEQFMKLQIDCNVACRGVLEPSYYLLGSDYRGNNAYYTLSYMSQMGGGAILDYSLLYTENRDELLRLAYASMLSSWALMNSGTAENNYGYWYPGRNNDGAAAGGFEPAPFGYTWLEQPHHRGAWYYSCEIDLGFSGYLRDSAVVFAKDALFGWHCFGGRYTEDAERFHIVLEDGIRKKLYLAGENAALMLKLHNGHFSSKEPVTVNKDLSMIELFFDMDGCGDKILSLQGLKGKYEIKMGEETIYVSLDKNIDKVNFYVNMIVNKISIHKVE